MKSARSEEKGTIGPGREGHDPLARRGYHHGHLRAALLEAARALLAERGTGAFSLADAAKIAGVSAAAPYRHFRDREALLGEVARQGYEAFNARLSAAAKQAKNPKDGFTAMGNAYLAFARDEPGLYAAMFSLDVRLDEAGQAAASRSFTTLVEAIAALAHQFGSRPGVNGPDPRLLALQVWSFSHGVASLARAGAFKMDGAPDAEMILASGVGAMIEGALMQARRPPVATGVWNKPPDGA